LDTKLFTRKKARLIFSISLLGLLVYFFFRARHEEQELAERYVFILGKKLYSTEPGGAEGDSFKYGYTYKNKIYVRRFTTFGSSFLLTDSLIFLKIQPDNPEICREISDKRVPSCLKLESVPVDGWSKLPIDSCR